MPKRIVKRAFVLCLLSAGPAMAASRPASEAAQAGSLLGGDWHVEAPTVGVAASAPLQQGVGWGSFLGAAGARDLGGGWAARLHLGQVRTAQGRLAISYASGNARAQTAEIAAWRATWAALGPTYTWALPERIAAVYLGLDAVLGYGGYAMRYDSDVAKSLEVPTAATAKQPLPHLSDGWLWGAALRGGLRLHLNAWLATQTELGAALMPIGAVPLSNNREIRDVRVEPHLNVLIYGAFSLRVAL